MVITYRSLLLLYCLYKLNGERTVYGIFHLLTGKKSSQTIGDANLYGLSHLFGTIKSITREQIQESTKLLLSKQLISEVGKDQNKYIITQKGKDVLTKSFESWPLPASLNGWKYNDTSTLFWQRLSLLTQVLSNLIYERKHYTAIQQDDHVIEWMKSFLRHNQRNRHELSQMVLQECLTYLENVTEQEATIFVMRLTSANRIGYTNEQISSFLSIDETYCHLLFINVLQKFIHTIESNMKNYPVFSQILNNKNKDHVSLTSSTRHTYELLQKGLTLEEIANSRNLKKNTIEDHIVEIIHNIPGFSIDEFVSEEHQEKVLTSYKKLKTKQLRPLKESVGNQISYFEIRLVLAKCGGMYEHN
ncbi:helix-turn-helix domain-containing protein [Fredinandcohnia sp. 179-A 10B2 NHS]|uniref:helix-turn-helix domain-containing protein n=1 Tax=Fredinandcohnia sp. 179-A 10B2 NHS TaxID=3235176 RepID=UPI0039A17C42